MINTATAIKTIMTKDPITIGELTTMDKVTLIFDKRLIHHVPVVNEAGDCTGVISMNDYMQIQDKFSIFNLKSSDKVNEKFIKSLTAREVMTADPVCIDENESIETAIEMFLANVYRSLIVTADKKIVGIVTPYDILKSIYESKIAVV